MAAPAYEYRATSPISIGGVLGYAEGDLVPASVVDAHDLHDVVEPADVVDGAQEIDSLALYNGARTLLLSSLVHRRPRRPR